MSVLYNCSLTSSNYKGAVTSLFPIPKNLIPHTQKPYSPYPKTLFPIPKNLIPHTQKPGGIYFQANWQA